MSPPSEALQKLTRRANHRHTFNVARTKPAPGNWPRAFRIGCSNSLSLVGLQADVYQQNGGSIPTITLQSTVTRSVPDSPLATTSFNTIAEFD
jgi:hypothetical protein